MKLFNIELVNIFNIPWERRLQTLAVVYFLIAFAHFFGLLVLICLVYLLFTKYFWIPLAYAIWFYLDLHTCERGGREAGWIRSLKLWHYFADYFPVHLIKTCDLDPSRNYFFCVSPHGILSLGIFANFSTEATGFSEKFPGLIPHLLTLKIQFYTPVHREALMIHGICAASEKSIKYILNNKGVCKQKGQVPVLVVGGAAESLEAKVNTYKLVLKNRRGFVRVALQTGTPLVPVFSFGENDSFQTVVASDDSFIRKFQNQFKKLLKFTTPVFYGRGIFNYNFGLLPFRRPIYTVVGRPIEIPFIENPSKEEIIKYHDLYIEELTKLFNEHKDKYISDKNTVLEII